MNICGIICEYNPFHSGHRYMIEAVRHRLGADCAVVCAVSGDFVQRGEAAIYSKHDRARAAVAGGADLVLELPLPWCMAPAEVFARGGVGLLAAAGGVTHLAFGSEGGDLAELEETARALRSTELEAMLREELAAGTPYAAARQRALGRLTGKRADVLSRPNDILAVEYLKAIFQQGAGLTPMAIPRIGAGHDSAGEAETPSAAFLREKLRAGAPVGAWIPAESLAELERGEGISDAERTETAILSRLRFLPEDAFAHAPDVSEGLENRVFRAARTAPTLEAAVEAASSKRHPRARVRRILTAAALGLKASDSDGIPPYLRVLAANGRGQALLRDMEARAALPLLTKPAHVRDMGERAERVFSLGAAAADLWALGLCSDADRRGDRDWRAGPAML